MFMIHAGISAALQTEYMRMIQERWPPESSSNTVLMSSPVEPISFCFLNWKYYVMSKLKPVPTNTLSLALFFFSYRWIYRSKL
jgi:hypothetical protein